MGWLDFRGSCASCFTGKTLRRVTQRCRVGGAQQLSNDTAKGASVTATCMAAGGCAVSGRLPCEGLATFVHNMTARVANTSADAWTMEMFVPGLSSLREVVVVILLIGCARPSDTNTGYMIQVVDLFFLLMLVPVPECQCQCQCQFFSDKSD